MRSPVAGRALALRAATRTVVTRAAVTARTRRALIHINGAVFAGEIRSTTTPVVVAQVLAGSAASARLRQTVVHLILAPVSPVPGNALTPVTIHQIDAGSAVRARIAATVVYIRLACEAGKAARAATLEAGAGSRRARTISAVRARIRRAVVDRMLALGTAVARRTGTFVAVYGVHAGTAVLARLVLARLYRDLAMQAVPSFRAFALVTGSIDFLRKCRQSAIRERVLVMKTASRQRDTYLTGTVVVARFHLAIFNYFITVYAGVSGTAATRIRSLSGIEACAAVSTRLVIGTVVEILITKKSSPAFVAQAVPGLLARTVCAARISLALVAHRTFPTTMASVNIKCRKGKIN